MDKSFYKNYFSFENNHWWFKARRGLIFNLIDSYRTNPDNSRVSIFDYGCASGSLVKKLQEAGFAVSGGDVSEEAINFGLANGVRHLNTIRGNATRHKEGSFDFVFALDILEHLPDESPVIKEIERILKPDGIGIFFVPAFQFLWGLQDEVSHHYRRYTLSQILSVLKKESGLRLVRSSYFNTFLFAPVAVFRLFARWFNLKGRESDYDINSKFLNFIFYHIFNFECRLLRYFNFPFGVSILLVLKKKQ
ncbi:MAG: type 11 methyltransferase [Parcubacteria group bacterium Gr01-1014_44]|nr:MAG: type 11 methyltransferase [Parcubacteria group bacterium Gr01-1014_44]